jgi:hypothetical protein
LCYTGQRFGMYAAYFNEQNCVEAWNDPQARQFITRAVVFGRPEPEIGTALPEAVDLAGFASVRVARHVLWRSGRFVCRRGSRG